MNETEDRPLLQPTEEVYGHPHTASANTALAALARHNVAAIYPDRDEAETVRQTLLQRGIAPEDIVILHGAQGDTPGKSISDEKSDEVLKDILVDGILGTAIGTGVGAVGAMMIVATNITLFVASPVIAPLAMLGWFAGLGGVVGAAAGSSNRTDGKFSELIKDAIQARHTVLLVRTHAERDQQQAKEVINESLKGRGEVAIESS
jgi:hypothetical protein